MCLLDVPKYGISGRINHIVHVLHECDKGKQTQAPFRVPCLHAPPAQLARTNATREFSRDVEFSAVREKEYKLTRV